MDLQLARHCALGEKSSKRVVLLLDQAAQQLYSEDSERRVKAALQAYYHSDISLTIEMTRLKTETPDQRAQRKQAERESSAELTIVNDPFVLELQEKLGAKILPNSIKLL